MAGSSASATTLMNGSAGDTAAAGSPPRLPVSRTQRPRTDPVDSGGHLVHWLVAAHFSVTAFRAGTVLLVDESGPALAARVAVSGLSCHGHVLSTHLDCASAGTPPSWATASSLCTQSSQDARRSTTTQSCGRQYRTWHADRWRSVMSFGEQHDCTAGITYSDE